jgi:hypothetical protein
MRRTIIAATAIAAALGPAATAHATLPGEGKDIAYDVKVEGSGKYTYSERAGTDDSWSGDDVALRFTYTGEISDGVVFRNAKPLDTTGDDIPTLTADGTYTQTGSGGDTEVCERDTGWTPAGGQMRVADQSDDDLLVPLDGQTHLWVRPLEHFDVEFVCDGGASHPGASLVEAPFDDDYDDEGNVKLGHNPFDIDMMLPRDIIGMGVIQQLDPHKEIDGVRCPGYINDQTTACHLEWSAKVTLTKLWEKPIETTTQQTTPAPAPAPRPDTRNPDDDLLVPLGPPTPRPDPDDDLLVPLGPRPDAKLSADASKATFSVGCTAACSGTASLTAAPGGAGHAAAVARPLARTAFTLRAGKSKTITLKLSRAARRKVRRAGGAKVVVRVRSGRRTATRTLRLRLARR